MAAYDRQDRTTYAAWVCACCSRGSGPRNPVTCPRTHAVVRCWVCVAGGLGVRSHLNPHGAAAGRRVAGAGGRSMPTGRSPRGSHGTRGARRCAWCMHGSMRPVAPTWHQLRHRYATLFTGPDAAGGDSACTVAQGGVSTVSPRRRIGCDVSSTGTNARFGELHGMHSLYVRSGSTHCQAHCTTAW